MVNKLWLDTACIIFGLVLVSFINLCVTLMQQIVKTNGPSLVKVFVHSDEDDFISFLLFSYCCLFVPWDLALHLIYGGKLISLLYIYRHDYTLV